MSANQKVKTCLKIMFQNSVIYKFFQFLKTPSAKQIVTYEPPDNPKIFILDLEILHNGGTPEFNLHGYNLKRQMKREGLRVDDDGPGKDIISHPTITLNSKEAELMTLWYRSKYNQFIESPSILTLLFKLLVLEPDLTQAVKWSQNGDSIEIMDLRQIQRLWGHEGVQHTSSWGFRKTLRSINYMNLIHPLINKSCSKANWLCVFLTKNKKYTMYYHISKNNCTRQCLGQPLYASLNLPTIELTNKQISNTQKSNRNPQKQEIKTNSKRIVYQTNMTTKVIEQVQKEVNFLKDLLFKIQNKCAEMAEDLTLPLSLSVQMLMWDKFQGLPFYKR